MPRNQGLVGIDVAYIIALFGTMFVTLFFVIGDRQFFLEHTSYYVFLDFFPALLFFLSGFTLALSLRDRKTSSRRKLSNSAKKGSILMLIGFLFVGSWGMNAFVALGTFYIVGGLIGQWSNFFLRTMAVGILFFSVVSINFEVPTYPLYSAMKMQGANMKDLVGYIFFNGYFSFLPWFGFFLMGLIFGRGDVRPNGWFPPSSFAGAALVAISVAAEIYSQKLYAPSPSWNSVAIYPINIKYFLPSFVLLQSGVCILFLNAMNYIFRKSKNKALNDTSRKLVEAKYSIYFLMLLIGTIILNLFNLIIFKQSLILIILNSLICILCYYGLMLWKRNMTITTPIEWLIKRISSSTRS